MPNKAIGTQSSEEGRTPARGSSDGRNEPFSSEKLCWEKGRATDEGENGWSSGRWRTKTAAAIVDSDPETLT